MVPRPKPFPDVYLHGAKQLGFDPRDCFVVEDSVTGVKAGVAAGATVIGYTGGIHRGPDYDKQLKAAGAAFTTSSMNVAGTFILNRSRTHRQQFGPQQP
jgi:beta-phosphoglucomutase-like phosphatase (HAD superfamily)